MRRPSDPATIAIAVMLGIVAIRLADRWFSIWTFPWDLLARPWILL